MRRSRYTITAKPTAHANEYLAFNTANAAFAILDAQAMQILDDPDSAFAEANTASAANTADAAAQATLQALEQAGFITHLTPAEELAEQQRIFDKSRTNTDALTLNILPTYACNYDCPYCYEKGHNSIPGKMDAHTMDKIMKFVQQRHSDHPFTQLSVQWYGGDPSLALDVVEALSDKLITWCNDHAIEYGAMMLTNANLIDQAAAQMLARVKVSEVLLTIDGPEEIHNCRRVAKGGSNSYERNIQAARYFRAQGINVNAGMNVDKVTWPLYTEFRDKLLAEEGIHLNPGKLCDYFGTFGTAPFCKPSFDLFTHEEFFKAKTDLFKTEPHTKEEMRAYLMPSEHFCSGQLDNYFVIDLKGDVYNCDGWVGDAAYARFNLFNDEASYKLHDIVFDPTRDELCGTCAHLPLCHGSCYWERVSSDMPCYPLKSHFDEYLQVYRDCYTDEEIAAIQTETGTPEVTLLAPPVAEILFKQFG